MREKIAFPQLVSLLSGKAGTTERMSELFLQELFAVVSQSLAEGETVKIKGLGEFRVAAGGDSQREVVFVPDDSLARAVNAPFAQFKPVELCDALTDERLKEIDDEEKKAATVAQEPHESQESQEKENINDPIEPHASQNVPEPGEAQSNDVAVEEVPEAPKSVPSRSVLPRKWLYVGVAAAVALLAAMVIFIVLPGKKQLKPQDEQALAREPSKPSVVTDTVKPGYSVHEMALRHYGDKGFWVWIFRENESAHPDYHNLPQGTVLVIPDTSKYHINSDSRRSLKEAAGEAVDVRHQVRHRNDSIKAAKAAASAVEIAQPIDDENAEVKEHSVKSKNHHRHHRHR